MAGMMAKYFATSLAIENVVSDPRVISNCFPIATISISFVGLLSRSTMFPASLAAMVPVFIATLSGDGTNDAPELFRACDRFLQRFPLSVVEVSDRKPAAFTHEQMK